MVFSMQAFMTILKEKHFLIEYTVNDISNELENIFFVHPYSLDIWRAFPHVLLIDATYKTNKYNMPFVQIVSTTSTNKTFSIDFSFIVNEKEESYNSVLTCLRSTQDKCMLPRVIVTDKKFALMNACQQVSPGAARLLCRWHIIVNITDNCRQFIKSLCEWEAFRAMWTVLVESPTLTLYNKNYEKIRSMLRKYPHVLDYLDKNWLLKYKEMFVSVWIDQHLNFEERTTNRVESQHARLKKYLIPNNKYSLERFIGDIDRFVRSQFPAIYDSFEKSMIFRNQEHDFNCLKELRGSVALEALDKIVGEIRRLYAHPIDSSNCGCKVRHSCGLPCACMLSPYFNSGIVMQ